MSVLTRLLALALVAAPLAACGSGGQSGAASAPTTQIATGQISGVQKDGVVAFYGVPYAAPPVGALRWRSPEPAANWTGVRVSNTMSASCPQVLNPTGGRLPWTPEYLIPGAMSEDCLTVNVWRPATADLSGAPVLFWIHGGGAIEGSNSVPIYDGAAFARQGVVVVSINYRLGVLANMTHPELSREQGGASGNYGFQDVLAALRWTRENAAAFGGDPAKITIAGQSAGSSLVTQLMGSPQAKGLFARAITESGSQWGTRPAPQTPAAADKKGEAFAASIGAPTLEQLRALPADQLVQKAAQFAEANGRFGAVLDGKYIVTDANIGQASPGFNDTPILSGFNADEESGSDSKYGSWTAAELAKKAETQFGPLAADAARLYPAASDTDAAAVGKTMARDRSKMIAYGWAVRRARVSQQPIYLYFFQHPHPGPDVERYGTFHSSEIPYVFGYFDPSRPFEAADRALSTKMMARWVGFIKGGSPNAPGLADWPRFDPAAPSIMLLGDEERVEPVLPRDKLDFADRWGARALASAR